MKYAELLKESRECPFDAPQEQEKITENECAYLTYALAPYHQDHLLVIPKRHIAALLELTPEEQACVEDLERTGLRILRELGYQNIILLARQGEDSGRTLEHLHFHLIPEIHIDYIQAGEMERPVMTAPQIEETLARARGALLKLTGETA